MPDALRPPPFPPVSVSFSFCLCASSSSLHSTPSLCSCLPLHSFRACTNKSTTAVPGAYLGPLLGSAHNSLDFLLPVTGCARVCKDVERGVRLLLRNAVVLRIEPVPGQGAVGTEVEVLASNPASAWAPPKGLVFFVLVTEAGSTCNAAKTADAADTSNSPVCFPRPHLLAFCRA